MNTQGAEPKSLGSRNPKTVLLTSLLHYYDVWLSLRTLIKL